MHPPLSCLAILAVLLANLGHAQIYVGNQVGRGGSLGGYGLGGGLWSFGGNCTKSTGSGWGSSFYGSVTTAAPQTTTVPLGANPIIDCGFEAAAGKVYGYYGYELPKPPVGMSYPNVGWPYSIPYPYFTQPGYGPVGNPYYGVPAAYYNPYLFGFGSYPGIFGAARSKLYAVPPFGYTSCCPPSELRFQLTPVYKGFRFGPGGQVLDYYRKKRET